jgi:hypothetical protein
MLQKFEPLGLPKTFCRHKRLWKHRLKMMIEQPASATNRIGPANTIGEADAEPYTKTEREH